MPDTAVDTGGRVRQLRGLWEHARNQKRGRYDTWTRNYRLVNNRLGGTASESWMPAPRSSEIYPILSTIVAWVMDQQRSVTVGAATTPHSDWGDYVQQLAQDLGTVLNTTWDTNHFPVEIKLLIWDALIYGAGFVKSTWDNSLDDGMGNIALKRCDPWSIYIDPKARSLDDAEYIIEARRMSLDEIERRFPGNREALSGRSGPTTGTELDEKPDLGQDRGGVGPGIDTTTISGSAGQFGSSGGPGDGRQGVNRNQSLKDMPTKELVVKEFWVKTNDEWWEEDDRGPAYSDKHVSERWRVTVMCENDVLLDEYADELWTHKKHPYTRYVYDDIGEMYGVPLVDHLAYNQIYINRLLTAMQMNVEYTGFPQYIEASNAGGSRTSIPAKPGTRIELKGAALTAAAQNLPRWLQPPAMPKEAQDLVQFWIARMENVAGISAAQKGQGDGSQGPARTNTAVMNMTQEVAFVRIRSGISNLEVTLEDVGQKLCSLIIDNYDEERTVAIVGQEGRPTSIALSYRHFDTPTEHGAAPLKYTLDVDAGASMPTTLQARRQQTMMLFTQKLIDRAAALQELNIPNWEEIDDRMKQEEQSGGGGMYQGSARQSKQMGP